VPVRHADAYGDTTSRKKEFVYTDSFGAAGQPRHARASDHVAALRSGCGGRDRGDRRGRPVDRRPVNLGPGVRHPKIAGQSITSMRPPG